MSPRGKHRDHVSVSTKPELYIAVEADLYLPRLHLSVIVSPQHCFLFHTFILSVIIFTLYIQSDCLLQTTLNACNHLAQLFKHNMCEFHPLTRVSLLVSAEIVVELQNRLFSGIRKKGENQTRTWSLPIGQMPQMQVLWCGVISADWLGQVHVIVELTEALQGNDSARAQVTVYGSSPHKGWRRRVSSGFGPEWYSLIWNLFILQLNLHRLSDLYKMKTFDEFWVTSAERKCFRVQVEPMDASG